MVGDVYPVRRTLLQQVLQLLSSQGGVVADELASLGASVGIGPLRKQIELVLTAKLNEDDIKLMVPRDVQAELVARGNQTVTLDNVRVTMKRMADDDELLRPDPDSLLYGLPGTPGIEQALETFKVMQRAQVQAMQAVNKKGQPR